MGVDWEMSKGLARGILRDRMQRRKLMARMLMVALGLMAAGLWLVDEWLMENPWRFLCWWGICAVVTGAALVFAMYDVLAVIREERGRR